MPKKFRIVKAPPQVERSLDALRSLVGLEFEDDPARVDEIINAFPHIPPVPSCFIAVDAKVILRALWKFQSYAAHRYWTQFALVFPLLYIPVWCCETLDDNPQGV